MAPDPAACSSGVRQQVQEDLLETAGVAAHDQRRGFRAESDRRGVGKDRRDVHCRAHDRHQVDRLDHDLELPGLDPTDVEEPLDEVVQPSRLRHGAGGVGRGLGGVAAGEPSFDELEVVVDCGRRRLELVPRGSHQAFEAEAHRAFGDVADRDHPAPRPILGGERFRHSLEPAALPIRIVDRELDPEPLAAGGPALRLVFLAERHPGHVLEDDLLDPLPEQAVVDDVRGDGPPLVVDRHDGVADAGKDRAQALLLLLGLALLVLDGDRLDAQLLGPGGEVLVGDAQLLDGRGQLLVECLELLIGRLELLVEGLDLLAACLRVLARAEHRGVGPAQVGDERGQLVVGTQQAFVDSGRLLESLPCPAHGRRARARSGSRRPARSRPRTRRCRRCGTAGRSPGHGGGRPPRRPPIRPRRRPQSPCP